MEDAGDNIDDAWADGLEPVPEDENAPSGFVLEEMLGRGGMAEVYLAHRMGPMGFQRKVVIKRIRPDVLGEPLAVQRFIREASLAAQFHHPNIVEVLDLITQDDGYYIVMEYLEGLHLGTFINKLTRAKMKCPPEIVAFVGARVASALAYAHSFRKDDGTTHCIVHRDISPENIIVKMDGSVKLIDFGVAKDLEGPALTAADRVIGKPMYLPPESLDGSQATPNRDVYSLGMTMWVSLVGKPPFKMDPGAEGMAKLMHTILRKPIPKFSEFKVKVPKKLEAIVMGCLSKTAASRPTARELSEELEEFMHEGDRVSEATIAKLLREVVGDKPIKPKGRALAPGTPKHLKSNNHSISSRRDLTPARPHTPTSSRPAHVSRTPTRRTAEPEREGRRPSDPETPTRAIESDDFPSYESSPSGRGMREATNQSTGRVRSVRTRSIMPHRARYFQAHVRQFLRIPQVQWGLAGAGAMAFIILFFSLLTGGDGPEDEPIVYYGDDSAAAAAPYDSGYYQPQEYRPSGQGTLLVQCGNWGWVAVDGKRVGICPSVNVPAYVGRHVVTVEAETSIKRRTVYVRRDRTTVVEFRRKRPKNVSRPDKVLKTPLQ